MAFLSWKKLFKNLGYWIDYLDFHCVWFYFDCNELSVGCSDQHQTYNIKDKHR